MQAGDTLAKFMERFDQNLNRPSLTPEEQKDINELFETLCRGMLMRHREYMQGAMFQDEDTGDVLAVYQLPLIMTGEVISDEDDGSYLYVLFFGAGTKPDDVDFSVLVSEHGPDDNLIHGHVYTLEDGLVLRTDVPPADLLDDDENETGHFDAIAYYRELFDTLRRSADYLTDEEKTEREEAKKALKMGTNEARENVSLEQSLGLNYLPISIDELTSLSTLLMQADALEVQS